MAREATLGLRRLRSFLAAPFRAMRRLWRAERPDEDHVEPPDVAVGRVVAILLGWGVFVAAALAGFGWFTLSQVDIRSPAERVGILPAPRLQVDPAADYDRLTAMQRKRLADYAWADRAKGTVEIPVDRAMAILVGRGERAFAPLAPPPSAPDARAQAVDAATKAGAAR
ncbi:hypothetical protein [Aureimonas leprariae]|uniref:Uncharacterized protein n=1 Tax=Plantimonas leprariae TaxID=2615207 RepID=A0A7V7U241_9HYPH|nr:hypothetical protein [Aureimonas leprariae]KAB0682973.1 hypothetical protein F6X38_02535 [Aureimonas leprariae]